MSEERSDQPNFDPSAMMVDFFDTWSKTWSKAMSETVNSEQFAQSISQQMESSMDMMALVRRQVGEFMEQYLQQVSLPSRKEVLSLAERLTNLELALDDVDAKLDEILDQLKKDSAA
jgi:polyhydroxyalkanoic acid synthase PhaR subunit